jgi:hypothetical protein
MTQPFGGCKAIRAGRDKCLESLLGCTQTKSVDPPGAGGHAHEHG